MKINLKPTDYIGILDNRYYLIKQIDDGATCYLYKVLDINTGEIKAAKIFKKGRDYEYKQELDSLKSISDSNYVIKYLSSGEGLLVIGEAIKRKYIILEYAKGSLFKYRLSTNKISEDTCKYIFYYIILAIKSLHEKGICHRDIKLENIIVIEHKPYPIVKTIDFGLSRFLNDEELAYSVLGTAINMDPGILHKLNKMENFRDYGYDEKADIWSLGTICYELLIGKSAFNSLTMKELLKKVDKGNYFLPKTLSVETMSFLNCMLQYDPKRRLSAEKLCNHKFLRYDVKDFNKINLKQLKKHDKGKAIQLNSKINESISDIFGIGILESIREENNEDYEDKDEKLINKINELSIKEEEKGDNEGMNNYKNKNFNKSKSIGGNLEEKFMKIFKEINADSMRIQQKVIPIIPGLEPDIENIDI